MTKKSHVKMRDQARPNRVVVAELLDRLAPRQRAAVVLRYLGDLTVPEVARALGCADGTVKSALHDALRNLRLELEPMGAPGDGPERRGKRGRTHERG